jgi:hypothetical protein
LAVTARPQKITFAEMRGMGVRGVLIKYRRLDRGEGCRRTGKQWDATLLAD